MAAKSGISWTESTLNPVAGCDHVSEGCQGCYAARDASGRLQHHPLYAGLAVRGVFTGEVRFAPERLLKPFSWRDGRKVFVNSQSDLFHDSISEDFVATMFAVMTALPRHTFQVLTKRPQRMRRILDASGFEASVLDAVRLGREGKLEHAPKLPFPRDVAVSLPAPNVWLGTSIELDKYVFRANHLRETPAAVRFLSCEPLLGPLPRLDLTDINLVIVGGESGSTARRMDPDWVRGIRDRCAASGVAFYFKQAGAALAREWGLTSRNGSVLEELPEEFAIQEDPPGVAA